MCEVEGVTHQFLVDTGCTYSAIRSRQPLSSESIQVVGVSGTPEAQNKTIPLLFQWGPSNLKHQFLYCPNCPINLLGRDLLCKLKCSIYLTEKGVEVSIDPITSTPVHPVRVLMLPIIPTPVLSLTQEIYWLKCIESGQGTPEVQFKFNQLRQLIYTFHPYKTPQAEIHCTLNVTDNDVNPYTDDWDENMMHLTPTIRCCTIVCGQEGVAAPVILPSHLKSWYLLGEESAPHVTLAVGHGFEARSLGPMIRRASKLQWEPTQTPGITKATTENMWRFMTVDTEEHCLPERLTLPRHHGYKVKMSKVQSCRRTVLFLGREISGEGAGLSKSHRDSILHHPRPITVSGMLSFLGLTGYSRTHIPDYTSRTEPLREIVREAGPRNLHSSLTWTPEASTAFALLKTDLSL
ncbi:unnamed protein product [Coregonus sp. 'balchen']|nr:unnamed protein product [Coregonus sp. 'balchen']